MPEMALENVAVKEVTGSVARFWTTIQNPSVRSSKSIVTGCANLIFYLLKIQKKVKYKAISYVNNALSIKRRHLQP